MINKIKDIFLTMGLTFTGIVYALTFTRTFIESKKENFLGTNQLSCILLFAFLLGLCSLIRYIPKVPGGLKRLIHFVLSSLAFFLCIIVLTDLMQTPIFIFFGLLLYTVSYLVVCGVKALINHIIARAASRSREDSMFEN
ncbi:MAG: hypothetical protein E7665_01845 [Ruminococcaceae bacterium]|nr:hypothetical protein [Oscillospiraceae bacterium]